MLRLVHVDHRPHCERGRRAPGDRGPRRRVEITAPDGRTIAPLSPYRFEQRGSWSVLLLGDLVAGQHLQAVIRIKFGYGPIGSGIGVLIGVTDKDGVLASGGYAPVAISWTYADDLANDGQARDRSVDRRVAALFAARGR